VEGELDDVLFVQALERNDDLLCFLVVLSLMNRLELDEPTLPHHILLNEVLKLHLVLARLIDEYPGGLELRKPKQALTVRQVHQLLTALPVVPE